MNERARNYGVVAPEVVKELGGLPFLKGIVGGTQPQAPMAETLGFLLIEVEEGRAVFEGKPEYRHYNPIGTVHGGFAATLLDSALGCAIFSTWPRAKPGPRSSSNSIWCARSPRTPDRCGRKAASFTVDARLPPRKAT